jgi:hypothetical protein
VPSPFVERAIVNMRELQYTVTIDRVPYEFQCGANEMMRIRKPSMLHLRVSKPVFS